MRLEAGPTCMEGSASRYFPPRVPEHTHVGELGIAFSHLIHSLQNQVICLSSLKRTPPGLVSPWFQTFTPCGGYGPSVRKREKKSRTITFLPPGVSSPGCWPSLGLLCPISTKVIHSSCKLLDSPGQYPHKLLCLHVTQVISRDTDANWHPGSFPHRVASCWSFLFYLSRTHLLRKISGLGTLRFPAYFHWTLGLGLQVKSTNVPLVHCWVCCVRTSPRS